MYLGGVLGEGCDDMPRVRGEQLLGGLNDVQYVR